MKKGLIFVALLIFFVGGCNSKKNLGIITGGAGITPPVIHPPAESADHHLPSNDIDPYKPVGLDETKVNCAALNAKDSDGNLICYKKKENVEEGQPDLELNTSIQVCAD